LCHPLTISSISYVVCSCKVLQVAHAEERTMPAARARDRTFPGTRIQLGVFAALWLVGALLALLWGPAILTGLETLVLLRPSIHRS
jgi:hypothetical protein